MNLLLSNELAGLKINAAALEKTLEFRKANPQPGAEASVDAEKRALKEINARIAEIETPAPKK